VFDVADGEDAGTLVSKAAVSTGTDVLQRDAPIGDGPIFMVRLKNGSMVSQAIFETALSLPLEGGAGELAAFAFEADDLAYLQLHFPRSHQRAHLLDAVRCRANRRADAAASRAWRSGAN